MDLADFHKSFYIGQIFPEMNRALDFEKVFLAIFAQTVTKTAICR
jgi:hypothetical protein